MVNLARRDDGIRVGSAHPVHGGADVVIADGLAVTDDHGDPSIRGPRFVAGANLTK
ncbi:MAG: hypothetical protein Q4G24_10915 [Paracoccus sp. (in: a-proteobacteria)]|uniref:hypothetical protein n=1 Tax=Paracoccus sp. TaxID=267 RepID=UPI0026DEAB57|nr:hypothetical protein [Paracoccus sp. (in: a-proteobacteria)]MDO5621970.1 hypothetical protein [Paracoccus sp. (in: a-proteobacteria)]